MNKMKHSVRKYIVTTVLATSFVFTPMMMGSVFAHGGPEAETTQENTVTTQEQTVQEQSEEESVSEVNTLLRQGDRGQAVEDLQTGLQNNGYNLSADGIFGTDTDNKVRDFQADQGLAVDGIAGPDTLNSLNGSTSNEGSSNESAPSNENEEIQINETTASNDEPTQTASPDQASVQSTTVETPAANSGDVVSVAQSLVGSSYTPGGTTPAGFDSSGFINYVFNQSGVSLNRTHAGMWANDGVHVDSASVGDVVFFENTYKPGVSHSGIYIGNGQMIHAGTEATGVEVTSMEIDYWSSRYIGAKSFN